MVQILPFKGVRPEKTYATEISAPPYDVINSEEAREIAKGRDKNYLRISRPEVDLPITTDEHDDVVYMQGRNNYDLFKQKGWLKQDNSPCYYVYKQKMGNHIQVGVVAVAHVDDYDSGVIKKHEFTRPDKEDDRTRHIDTVGANTEPVFFTYKAQSGVDYIVNKTMMNEPEYNFVSDDGVSHILWVIDNFTEVSQLQNEFAKLDCMYVADGHHRSAAASRVRKLRQAKNENHMGFEEYNTFLTVVFPDNQMNIMPYNRVVKDLNGNTLTQFLEKIASKFDIDCNGTAEPGGHQKFSMYLEGKWYILTAKDGSFNKNDEVKRLDASILQDNLLHPILGIENPRTDKRINFIGGIRGTKELVTHVDTCKYQVAFSLHPVTISQLIDVANSGQVMPPKSTWFEPKLRSGLFIHEF